MSINSSSAPSPFTPRLDGRALDFIKICAAALMVVDHIDYTLLDRTQLWMFVLGRAVFPLFCFAVATAVFKAGPEKGPHYGVMKYAPRLLLLALVTEPISRYARDIDVLNVLFTLSAGAALAGLSWRIRDAWLYALLPLAAVLQLFLPSVMEFDLAGAALPAAFLMALRGRKYALPLLLLLLCTVNAANQAHDIFSAVTSARTLTVLIAAATGAVFIPAFILDVAKNLPRDGRFLSKYALHVFYPGHLLLIHLVAVLAGWP